MTSTGRIFTRSRIQGDQALEEDFPMPWGPERPQKLWRARGEGPGLSTLMDELLGGHIGRPLALAGPASAKVAEVMESPETGQSFLAGLFWWLFSQSEGYRDAAKHLRASRSARPIVVCHAHGTRFDLLLLDARRRRRLRAVQLERAQTYARPASQDSLRQHLENMLHRFDLSELLGPETLLRSAYELAASSEFGVAIINAPLEIPTCALSPAVPVQAYHYPVATLGSFLTDIEATADDTCLATTANHALDRHWRTLRIDGTSPKIVHRHKPSDSCLVRVNKSIMDGRQRYGLKGPLKKTPRLNAPAFFDGAISGPTPTLITANDLAIMDPQPEEMCRVYTEPDTAHGDSGAALIDEDDYIVGFAYTVSKYFSTWVWAEQVYMAHKLLSRVALGV
jgi:hypothetical protein